MGKVNVSLKCPFLSPDWYITVCTYRDRTKDKATQLISGRNEKTQQETDQSNTDIKTSTTRVARSFYEHGVASYGIRSKLRTDSGFQFVVNFFVTVYSTLGGNNIKASYYHSQTNCRRERFNFTLISQLRHYVPDLQAGWDPLLSLLSYKYNIQVYRSINVSTFSPSPKRALSVPAVAISKRAFLASENNTPSRRHFTMELVRRVANLCREADKHLNFGQ